MKVQFDPNDPILRRARILEEEVAFQHGDASAEDVEAVRRARGAIKPVSVPPLPWEQAN